MHERRRKLTDAGGEAVGAAGSKQRPLQAYVNQLSPDERRRLDAAFEIAR